MKQITREYRKEIGKRIKQERERLQETQEAFSENVGVSKQVIVNLENGLSSLKVEYLYQICLYCGCDIGFLLGECDCSTYNHSYISKETGLSEEAIKELRKQAARYKKNNENESLTLIEILNIFITSNNSPLYNIASYRRKLEIINTIKNKPYFNQARKTFLEAKKENEKLSFEVLIMIGDSFIKKFSNLLPQYNANEVLSEMFLFDIIADPGRLELDRSRLIVEIDKFLKSL